MPINENEPNTINIDPHCSSEFHLIAVQTVVLFFNVLLRDLCHLNQFVVWDIYVALMKLNTDNIEIPNM